MVVGVFPVAKLGVLALKQISKPIAHVLKDSAKQSPFFRKYVCMPPAQMYNWIEIKTKMWALNLGKPTNIPKLNEAMAIELGSNLLGEFIIFSIGAGILIFEYKRQTNKEMKKDEALQQEKKELNDAIQNLALRLERQDAEIRQLERIIADLDSKWIRFSMPKLRQLKELSNKIVPIMEIENELELKTPKVNEFVGNYNPQQGILFKALNVIENEIFY